jgi:hypothetical protein
VDSFPLRDDATGRIYTQTRLEVLPADFFRELVRRFPDEVFLLSIWKDDRMVAFAWGILTGRVYRDLFIGFDNQLNETTDLYFNLMILDLEHALSTAPEDIYVGQTADVFKSRLGCHGRERYIYVACTTRLLQWTLRALAPMLFPPAPAAPERDLYRDS